MLTVAIDPRKEMIIKTEEYQALLAASLDDNKRLYSVASIARLFDRNKRTLQKLASEKPLLITKDATGTYVASLKNWKKLLGHI